MLRAILNILDKNKPGSRLAPTQSQQLGKCVLGMQQLDMEEQLPAELEDVCKVLNHSHLHQEVRNFAKVINLPPGRIITACHYCRIRWPQPNN